MCVTLHKYGWCWQLQNDDFIHRRQTRQSRDEKIDNFVSIHKKSSWSSMIIAAKSVYFLSTPLKSVYFLSNSVVGEAPLAQSINRRYHKRSAAQAAGHACGPISQICDARSLLF
jgi:hypothetical protein